MSTVSVVIASHGYGHLAGHCIESVLDQTRKPDAVLFVEDGVNDCGHLRIVSHLSLVIARLIDVVDS